MPSATHNTPTSPARHTFSWLLLIIANLLWAASYVTSRLAPRKNSVSFTLAAGMTIASLILLLSLVAHHRELHPTHSDFAQFTLLVLIGFVINKLLEYNNLALTTASYVALLISSASIFLAALSLIIVRERTKKVTLLALLLGLLGVYLIVERRLISELPVAYYKRLLNFKTITATTRVRHI